MVWRTTERRDDVKNLLCNHSHCGFEGRPAVSCDVGTQTWLKNAHLHWRSMNDTKTRRRSCLCDEWGLDHLGRQRVSERGWSRNGENMENVWSGKSNTQLPSQKKRNQQRNHGARSPNVRLNHERIAEGLWVPSDPGMAEPTAEGEYKGEDRWVKENALKWKKRKEWSSERTVKKAKRKRRIWNKPYLTRQVKSKGRDATKESQIVESRTRTCTKKWHQPALSVRSLFHRQPTLTKLPRNLRS